jgi:hypothetical protein
MRDRQRGVVYHRPFGKRFFFIKTASGERIFCSDQQVRPPKGHFCLFNKMADVEFEIVTDPISPDKLQAINCRLIREPEIGRETSVVIEWNGTFGLAIRLCGCDIHINAREILSEDRCLTQFGHGSQIQHDSESFMVGGKRKFRCFNIDVIKPDSGEEL